MREEASGPDWRDADAYAPLLEADRSLVAWEWLRRDPSYRSAARLALAARISGGPAAEPGRFGLIAFESPGLAVPRARPMWRAEVHPYVLRTHRLDDRARGDLFDLDRLRGLASISRSESADHLLLSDGLRTIRLDGPPAALAGGPVGLGYRLEGLASAQPPLLTLRRFLALCRTGRFAKSLHRREPRARRWILMLRARDALAAGAGQREIAGELLSRSATEPRWRSREPSIRLQVQRLVHAARAMAAGGYRQLLGAGSTLHY